MCGCEVGCCGKKNARNLDSDRIYCACSSACDANAYLLAALAAPLDHFQNKELIQPRQDLEVVQAVQSSRVKIFWCLQCWISLQTIAGHFRVGPRLCGCAIQIGTSPTAQRL